MLQMVTILGSTGSIGKSTLDVIARHPDRFSVFALCAHQDAETLFVQCQTFSPKFAVLGDEKRASDLKNKFKEAGIATEVLYGQKALCEMASHPEVSTVMAAIVGAAGLLPTMAAVKARKKVLLANKESLVMAGALFMAEVQQSGAVLLPIDSEHNAIFQSLPRDFSGDLAGAGVEKILLTASGGPFRNTPLKALQNVTPDEACAHPKWKMGKKISVDSATLMNKGLEMIEAHWLFSVPASQIEVVVHPESIIHSLVQYVDGSVIAELGNPDMRTPIAHALAYPERITSGVPHLNLCEIARLHFEAPDHTRFPALSLAYQAITAGQNAPLVLNAANEIAVQAFLEGKIAFLQISEVVKAVLNTFSFSEPSSIEALMAADDEARKAAATFIAKHKNL